MTCAVDSSVLLDVFSADPTFGHASLRAVLSQAQRGPLVACEVVWAEVAAFFPSGDEMAGAMERLDVGFSALTAATALFAGGRWKAYRLGGGTRERLMPDILIGAHAFLQADRLLTRDRGFHRQLFTDLVVLGPEGASP